MVLQEQSYCYASGLIVLADVYVEVYADVDVADEV